MSPCKKPKLDDLAPSELSNVPRTKRGRGSRTVGKLAPLFEMPVDIWFEIVSHLTPKELLALSRTSKHFRTMLMHRSGKHFWAAARLNVGLPEPPQHISEPRLAAMLFSSTCFGCGNRGFLYDIGLIVRHCRRCKMEKVMKGCALGRTYCIPYNGSMPVLQLLPCSRGIFRSYHDVHAVNDESSDSYEVGEFENVFFQHSALLEGGDQVALQAFVDERQHLVQAARQFSKELKEWEREQCAAKQDVGRIRQESIEMKLLELGYAKTDLDEFTSWAIGFRARRSWDAIVRQPHKLTPRTWKRIRPQLETLLADAKTERERRERQHRQDTRVRELRNVYADFVQSVPEDDGALPPLGKAEQLPAVRALLDENEARVPVTVERLHSVLPALREAVQPQSKPQLQPQPKPQPQPQPPTPQQEAVSNAQDAFFHSLPDAQKAMLSEVSGDDRKTALARLFADHLTAVRRRWGPQSQQQQQQQQIEYPAFMGDTGGMNNTDNVAEVNNMDTTDNMDTEETDGMSWIGNMDNMEMPGAQATPQMGALDHRAEPAWTIGADLAEPAPSKSQQNLVGEWSEDLTEEDSRSLFVLDGGVLTLRELMPEELQDLPGAPADIEDGSEDDLSLATALFRCDHCVDQRRMPGPDTEDTVYNITELAAHVRAEHPAGGFIPVQSTVDSEVARKILRQVGLPEYVRYEEVSGRIVCGCATFRHPATFAQLVSHIARETSFYHALNVCSYFSSCPSDEFLHDQHDFTSAAPFLRLLGADESFSPAPLSDAEAVLAARWAQTFGGKPLACRVCALCTTVPHDSPFWWQNAASDDVPYVPHAPSMDSVALVRHVKMMHGREARLEDAQEKQEVALP
ncbi:F-box protein [Phanerochaete sordida]|uniref:F-box protein n=1 Tax=Phanerochaete sordida TaxID=48140 RepID=A0A9P3GD65_9APHY|nr:F-box protein [Phanerochaete sordida]